MGQLLAMSEVSALLGVLRRQQVVVVLRAATFIGALLLAWLSLRPFEDLAELDLANTSSGNDTITYAVFGGLALLAGLLTIAENSKGLATLLSPGFLIFGGWIAVSVVLSTDPATSIKRFTLTAAAGTIAATLFFLPRSQSEMARWFGAAVLGLLATCYLGILLVPNLSIHLATDLQEPLLAGDWRGTFAHKNIAGPMMADFVFFGLFIARARNVVLGYAITAAAAIFLWFCHAKAATGLLPLVLVLSFFAARTRSRLVCALLVFAPAIILNLATVGSLYFESVKAADTVLLKDPTFTGRNDIWQFAIDNIRDRPWFGHGFGAFWQIPVTVFQPTTEGSMATTASHAHNAFLDLMLTIGIPGVLLAALWTVVLPFVDWQRSRAAGADADLAQLFVRIWMFSLYTGAFESILFERGSAPWFTMLLAMFGLRYLSVARLNR